MDGGNGMKFSMKFKFPASDARIFHFSRNVAAQTCKNIIAAIVTRSWFFDRVAAGFLFALVSLR